MSEDLFPLMAHGGQDFCVLSVQMFPYLEMYYSCISTEKLERNRHQCNFAPTLDDVHNALAWLRQYKESWVELGPVSF